MMDTFSLRDGNAILHRGRSHLRLLTGAVEYCREDQGIGQHRHVLTLGNVTGGGTLSAASRINRSHFYVLANSS
ncbi:hypothetical protein WKW77_33390 [Variovorax ureilyticus]|uniref:Uncharacterized protein n=1 Tax=Variovorax ureilyticus TaxID=1836198 RepID=A0ABU8VQQ2_9BURK